MHPRSNPGTIIVLFQPDASQHEIDDLFDHHRKVEYTQVSSLTNTYAVDVPAGEEQRYIDLFQKDPVVKHVNPYPIMGRKLVSRPKNDENSDKSNKNKRT